MSHNLLDHVTCEAIIDKFIFEWIITTLLCVFYFTKRALSIRSNYTCFLQLAARPQAPLQPYHYELLCCYTVMQLLSVDCIRRGRHEWAVPPLGLEDYNPAAKPRDNQNFLSLGVLCSIETSFKFCQSLPVAIDNSAELSQPAVIAAVELRSGSCVSGAEVWQGRNVQFQCLLTFLWRCLSPQNMLIKTKRLWCHVFKRHGKTNCFIGLSYDFIV